MGATNIEELRRQRRNLLRRLEAARREVSSLEAERAEAERTLTAQLDAARARADAAEAKLAEAEGR
jgi:predicted RNase H-like nuclease (RuvC/YqgF family)